MIRMMHDYHHEDDDHDHDYDDTSLKNKSSGKKTARTVRPLKLRPATALRACDKVRAREIMRNREGQDGGQTDGRMDGQKGRRKDRQFDNKVHF